MQWLHVHRLSHTLEGHVKIVNFCSRALRTSCHGNSLPVTSSVHMTCCAASSISANIACFFHDCVLRGLLRLTCTNSLRPDLFFPRQFGNSSIFQSSNFPILTPFITMLFKFNLLPTCPNSPMFDSTRRDVLHLVTFDLFCKRICCL